MLMALVVMFSTLSFTVESHYCGNRLVDTAIFTQVEGCGMEMNGETPMKKGCCKDEIEVVKGQDELKFNAFEDLNFDQQFVLTSFIYSYVSLFESLPKKIIPHRDYIPPNLTNNIQLLDGVFII